MKSYHSALRAASELCNMPDPESSPSKFIAWAEDICELIGNIYDVDYERVCEDFQEKIGFLIEDEEDAD